MLKDARNCFTLSAAVPDMPTFLTILACAAILGVPAFDDPSSAAYAARVGRAADVKRLLEANPKLVDEVDEHHRTLFLYAAKAGHVPVLEILLKYQPAEIDRLDSYGYAPIHWAAMYAKLPVLTFFHEHKLNLDTRDYLGQSALHLAMGNPFSNIHRKHAEVVELLLKYGADPTIRDKQGATPLHVAAGLVGQAPAAKAIVEKGKGVQIDAQDERGNTPLHRAAAFANVALLDYLLKQKADPAIMNKDGLTPLEVAKKSNLARSAEVIRLLSTDLMRFHFELPGIHPSGADVAHVGREISSP
jgi:ankyrin repeat protein